MRLRLFVVACSSLAAPASAQRLPANVTPEHYDITVTPDLAAASSPARRRISVSLAKPSDRRSC